jgi:hypothetical protein
MPDFGPQDAEMQPLYLAIGRASMMWSNIENNLCHWYDLASGQNEYAMSRATFFSVSGYTNRAAMLRSAMRFNLLGDQITAFIQAALKKTDGWVTTRNRIAHGVPARVGHPRDIQPVIADGSAFGAGKVDLNKALSVKQLDVAATNFRHLAIALWSGELNLYPVPAEPIAALRLQVRLLPNDPTIEESNQIREARQRQFQADDAKRAAHAQSTKPGP